jgi:GntR family transcriptional regulator
VSDPAAVAALLRVVSADPPAGRDTYRDVKQRLHALAAALGERGESRMPSEEVLGAELGVSRPTVRSALLALEKEGVVQRLHGRGTFINRHALDIRANLAVDRPFVDVIADLGEEPSVRNLVVERTAMPADIAAALDEPVGADGCRVERVFEASGEPAVYSVDWVPWRLLRAPGERPDGEESVFALVERHTDHRVRYSVAEIVPVRAEARVADALGLDAGQAVLLLAHRHLDDQDRPVATTHAYLHDGRLRFSIVRTYRNA